MFEKYGINPEYVIIGTASAVIILLILCIVLLIRLSIIKRKYQFFMKGNDGKSLETAISRRIDQIDTLMVEHEMLKATIDKINKRTANSFKKFGLVKYDAFDEAGQQCFTLCMLDDNEDGFVINSIHGTDGSYTYMKEIINGNPYTRLSFEEQEALDKAKVEMEE